MPEILNKPVEVTPRVAAVVLAAGQSRRLGTPKQLVTIDGESLLRRTALTVLASRVAATFVVLGYQHELLVRELDELEVVLSVAEDFSEGLSRSVRHGLYLVQSDTRNFQAALFVPCDLPFLSSEHLNLLISRYQETRAPVVCSEFGDTQGIPAIFDAETWPDFQMLQGDQGARPLIQKCVQRQTIPFEGGVFDVDTPADVERWRHASQTVERN